MELTPLELSAAKKLNALREVDIFHRWDSLDEKRFCRRCGQTFSGHAIKVFRGRRNGGRYRLECPTEGCPSVPIEWIVPEAETARQRAPAEQAHGRRRWRRSTLFTFLRVPRMFI